jgi:hypothetical protein
MIDLNPLVIERHQLDSAPPNASPEEYNAKWYQITDKITYMPGVQSSVTYNACLHDLVDGLQTHTFAPAGVEIRARWTIGGTLPGETPKPAELGMKVPSQGLYLQEETDLKCNFLMTSFIKKNLKKAHSQVVEKIIGKARDMDARPPVPPKDPSLQHSRGTSYSSQNPSQRPLSPSYSTFASESSPDLSSQTHKRYPPEYQHYRQDSEQLFAHHRASSRPEQNAEPYLRPPRASSQLVEMPSQGPQRPPAELAG